MLLFGYRITKFHIFVIQMAKDWQYRLKREKEKENFKEFDEWSRQDLMEHILELRSGIAEIEEIAKDNGSGGASGAEIELSESDYKQTWSYPTKIAFLITVNKKPLTSDQLEELLRKRDTHFKDYSKPRNNLTVTLNRAVKSRRITKVKVPGIRSLFYALPAWLDKEGNLKPAFALTINFFK